MGALPPFCVCVCSVLVFRKRMGKSGKEGGRNAREQYCEWNEEVQH